MIVIRDSLGRNSALQRQPRPAVVDKVHRQIRRDLVAIADAEALVAGEVADDGHLDVVDVADLVQARQVRLGGTARTMRSWASESQISHGRKARILERDVLQVDIHTDVLGPSRPRRTRSRPRRNR